MPPVRSCATGLSTLPQQLRYFIAVRQRQIVSIPCLGVRRHYTRNATWRTTSRCAPAGRNAGWSATAAEGSKCPSYRKS